MAARGSNPRELVIRKGTSQQLPGEDLFDIVSLNNLEVSGFAELCNLSTKIVNLENLLQLILKQNGLTCLPSEIGALKLLKFLDVSSNKLDSLPVELYELSSLQTLILNNNKLQLTSFPDVSQKECLPHLQYVDLAHNQIEELPSFLFRCSQLSELFMAGSLLKNVSDQIGNMSQLKTLDLSKNSISDLPRELSNCSKLRSLLLMENPIVDRRLLKLINQHGTTKPRTILDYVHSRGTDIQLPRKHESKAKKKGKKSAGKKLEETGAEHDNDDDDVVVFSAKYCIKVVKPSHVLEVRSLQSARAVRQYIVCCVIKNVDLASPGNFKKFITIQTKLHDSVCRKRKLCTIATHDFSLVQLPLVYTAGTAEDIRLTPLGFNDAISVKEFVSLLEANKPTATRGGAKAQNADKDKPSNQTAASLSNHNFNVYTGLLLFANPIFLSVFDHETNRPFESSASWLHNYRYLELIGMSENFAYLVDSSDRVISLPPLTNCECSKITPSTVNVLVEVTSSRSLQACKTAMDSLVFEMLQGGVSCGMAEQSSFSHEIVLEQCRGIDDTGTLLVAYPSRPDLAYNNDDIEIKREL